MNKISKNRIEILCPSQKCRKCTRIVRAVERLIKEEGIEADLIIIDQLEVLITKRTWVLPTIIVNDKIVARGYMPEKQKIITGLH